MKFLVVNITFAMLVKDVRLFFLFIKKEDV